MKNRKEKVYVSTLSDLKEVFVVSFVIKCCLIYVLGRG